MNIKFKKIAPVALIFILGLGCAKKEASADNGTETKSESPSHKENIVTLKKENLQHVTLKIEPAEMGSLGMTLKAAGRVSFNLVKTAKVTPTLEGRLTKVNFDLNDQVKAGDTLALIESPELLGKALELKAPSDGIIVERNVTVGELVEKSKSVCTISDPTKLWVIADVKERDIAAVKLGQEAAFSVLAYPQEKFNGKIVLVANQVESGSRTIETRIEVDNADGRLKPGMFTDVEITTTILNSVLVIPDTALQTDGDDQIVFVANDETTFEKRVVKLGEEQSGRVQILEGLKIGDKIVSVGSFILKSEMLKGEMGED